MASMKLAPFRVVLGIYTIVSIAIFYVVYETSKLVIDEEFHLRQGREYCNGNFHIWDHKITTFPGLYLVSSVFLAPLSICNTFALRLTSLIASIVNLFLIHEIRRHVGTRVHAIKIAMEALVLSVFPPMYFFAHVYYTDILSITMTLALINFQIKQNHYYATIFGYLSVAMRQTNIVWVGHALGATAIDKLTAQTLPFLRDRKRSSAPYTMKDLIAVIKFYVKRYYLVPKQIRLLASYLSGYISVLVAFLIFVYLNGSIVVGDKKAHEAAIHLPQILYFSIFFLFFSPSMFFTHYDGVMKMLRDYWRHVLVFSVFCFAIVHFNTITHPYLLADNRHYVFYIWNKFYGRYWWARYAMVPAYTFATLFLYKVISMRTAGFQLVFSLSTILVIALQRLIEFRYFIMPFLIMRLLTTAPKTKWLLLELIFYVTVNAVVFYLFKTKEIYWQDMNEVQRLIW